VEVISTNNFPNKNAELSHRSATAKWICFRNLLF